jgi:aminomethyltransferase
LPVGTALHDRTFALCETLNYREWAGYYAVSAYEPSHEHEYHAIRHAAALIDITPLYKYVISGRDATRFVDRVITRDLSAVAVGQMIYTPWCDERGKVIDDGTVARLRENRYRWTAADPNLRWFRQNAFGLDISIEDVSEQVAALALQGPTAAQVLREVADVDVETLRYFRVASGRIGRTAVDISRTGYTGDLGYEIWTSWHEAVKVWDALMEVGPRHGLRPAGMLALDIARIEAGLLLIEVDFFSSRRALIDSQLYSPLEMGLKRLVSLDKAPFIGQRALTEEHVRGSSRQIVGLEIDWIQVEALHDRVGLAPQVPAAASRVAVPVYGKGGRHIGRATSTTWSPVLKKLIALATLSREYIAEGTVVQVEFTVEAVRHRVAARVVKTPFFSPPRKTASPPP